MRVQLRTQFSDQPTVIENMLDYFRAPHYVEFAIVPVFVQMNLVKFVGDGDVFITGTEALRRQHIDTDIFLYRMFGSGMKIEKGCRASATNIQNPEACSPEAADAVDQISAALMDVSV